ncbi:MAG: NAD(P)H-dependent oxidoreductase [Flavobacteriaceae bacterium]|nr:NAD(P)H-dependent oxidoreductase [Flavobacteriaceae bacterium]
MKKTLVILAHPDLENSVGSKTIIASLSKLPNISVLNLTALYPDFNIDVASEQTALAEADLIILQYPIYWYNMPPILKQWFDKVFTFGFAFGAGAQLTNKTIISSVTAGAPESSYPEGEMKRIMLPVKATAAFCKINYLNPIASYGIYSSPDQDAKTRANILKIAQTHAYKLESLITNF